MSIKGLDTFFDVLAVIKNTDSFEKRLQELAEATQKYEEAIKSVAGLQNAQEFLSEIASNRKKAKEELDNAHNSSSVIRASAEKFAQEQKKLINEQSDILNKKSTSLSALETSLHKQERDLLKQSNSLNKREEALTKAIASLKIESEEVNKRKQKLMNLLND